MQWAGVFSPAGVWEGVHALRKVGFESQLWSWAGAGTEQKSGGLVPTFRTRVVWNRSNQREDGKLGGFSLPLLSDPQFTTVDLWQPRLICLRCGSPAADPETSFHVKRQEGFPGKLSWGWGEVGRGREGHTKQSPWKLCLSLAGTSTNSVGFTWGLLDRGGRCSMLTSHFVSYRLMSKADMKS